MKRKAKEQIANGMSDIQSVLAAMEAPLDTTEQPTPQSKGKDDMVTSEPSTTAKPTASSKSLKIGEGKAVPLSKKQRKKAL